MEAPPSMTNPPSSAFDNASMWHNFISAVNVTKYAPSIEDLVLAGPRMVMRLGRLGSFISFPDAIDGFGQRVIPDKTDASLFSSAATPTFVTTAPSTSASLATDQDPAALVSRFSMEGVKGIGSVFSYATSKWALCCIAMAVILNRTHIFAATRRRLRLRWPVRLLLRITPIILFVMQARSMLQSIQCQTSPDFAELRWGNASKSSDLMFSQNSSILHGMSSYLLFGATDKESCRAVQMIPQEAEESPDLKGSLSLLWPLFGTFCLSQFLETVSCAVQGRPVAAETGMTLFEHSLAFAEADAAISNQLGWGFFTSAANASEKANLGANMAISRTMIMKRVNTPPEVLLIALFSALSHITSHILGIFGKQAKFRLISTGFWAMCFMGSIVWSAFTFSLDDPSRQGLLRYPTVCIIGFIPHVLVLAGIIVCFCIYSVAILLCAIATPADVGDGRKLSFRERFAIAYANMQANVSFTDIRISMDHDFYNALLRAGFGAITLASEAVYLNEDRRVNLRPLTWLEEERYREIRDLKQWVVSGLAESRYDAAGAIGLVPVQVSQLGVSNGYARERAAQTIPKSFRGGERRVVGDGVGATERSGRWLMALDYMLHINKLILRTWALFICKLLSKIGVQHPPAWLRRWAQRPKAGRPEQDQLADQRPFELLNSNRGTVQINRNIQIDVEHELRHRIHSIEQSKGITDLRSEEEVDDILYRWWRKGGWWGMNDASADFMPADNDSDFDATSVISGTETDISLDRDGEAGWESDDGNDDGQRTPTQRSPCPSREGTPIMDNPMEMADLARLLHPRSPEEREQARALSAHLGSETIMTRAGYRRFEQAQRSHVLFPNHQIPTLAKMTPDEEEQVLEQILLSRRAAAATDAAPPVAGPSAGADSWATGAAGMGSDGPQCVVCQCAPRTIIVWPCRCLSLCDDCRVSLAMNNFDKCVCCRREVISFSRIFVP